MQAAKEEDIEERMNLQPPMVDNVLKIADRYYDQRSHYYYSHYDYNSKPQLNDSMVIPHYMDAAISGVHKYNACVYFFKVNSQKLFLINSDLNLILFFRTKISFVTSGSPI